ncbi:glycosyl hydrolase [Aureococcus anophagefferens]|nr:glycosyl hydrolase [Aureococcus anophagefferens]
MRSRRRRGRRAAFDAVGYAPPPRTTARPRIPAAITNRSFDPDGLRCASAAALAPGGSGLRSARPSVVSGRAASRRARSRGTGRPKASPGERGRRAGHARPAPPRFVTVLGTKGAPGDYAMAVESALRIPDAFRLARAYPHVYLHEPDLPAAHAAHVAARAPRGLPEPRGRLPAAPGHAAGGRVFGAMRDLGVDAFMRVDDDVLFLGAVAYDPFQWMYEAGAVYVYGTAVVRLESPLDRLVAGDVWADPRTPGALSAYRTSNKTHHCGARRSVFWHATFDPPFAASARGAARATTELAWPPGVASVVVRAFVSHHDAPGARRNAARARTSATPRSTAAGAFRWDDVLSRVRVARARARRSRTASASTPRSTTRTSGRRSSASAAAASTPALARLEPQRRSGYPGVIVLADAVLKNVTNFGRGARPDGVPERALRQMARTGAAEPHVNASTWIPAGRAKAVSHALEVAVADACASRRLERYFFNSTSDGGPDAPVDLETGYVGGHCHGNEPGHHAPYLFNAAGAPHRAQAALDRIAALYTARDDGLPGNDDVGQTSAWFVWASLGLYPVDPCGDHYELSRPLFADVSVDTGAGRTLRIVVRNAGLPYVRAAFWGEAARVAAA